MMPTLETISCALERVIFYAEKTGYLVGKFRREDDSQVFTACGKIIDGNVGECFDLEGQWVLHSQYGRQFQIANFRKKIPTTMHAVERYLSSGLINGIGPVYAKRIVAKFGAETMRILSEEPRRLAEISGIGKQRLALIVRSWNEQQAARDLILDLQAYDIPLNLSLQIYRQFGGNSLNVIRADPYRLAREVSGIGFKTADEIAKKVGLRVDSPQRLRAGILHTLQLAEADGHTCYDEHRLLERASEILMVPKTELVLHLEKLIGDGSLQRICRSMDEILIQKPQYFFLERDIEYQLDRLQKSAPSVTNLDLNEAIAWSQSRADFRFADEQILALRIALREKISILTGGPGTGKTTIVQALTKILKRDNYRVELTAPTGRAAQKMAEATGISAKTLHRLLHLKPSDGTQDSAKIPAGELLQTDYLIVDEASMIDEFLAVSLFRALPQNCSLLIVGDGDQLPSVGPGNVMGDLIDSNRFPVARLRRIFRQNDGSNIPSVAQSILTSCPFLPKRIHDYGSAAFEEDIVFIPSKSPDECVQVVKDLVATILPKRLAIDPFDDVQVLAPMHRGIVGIQNLNEVLQRQLLHTSSEVGKSFLVGDKIIQTKNNYEKNIFNGDLGRVQSVDRVNQRLLVSFDIGPVLLEREEQADLAHAYAISIHKAQGSEFPIVILPLVNQHFVMLRRNLLYTAITRGKKKVIFVGDESAYFIAAKSIGETKRYSNLLLKNRPESATWGTKI